MKKILFFILTVIILFVPFFMVRADYYGDDGMGRGAGSSGEILMVLCLLYLLIMFFVFSVIFWLVHNWLVKK